MMSGRNRTYQDYTVGWICALEMELSAAIKVLDYEHPRLPSVGRDLNIYRFGSINRHNVVIACLPDGETGNNPAAMVATRMTLNFPSLRFGLMVGIGGGVPSLPDNDVRLGDVVVSSAVGKHGGIVQYDRGKSHQKEDFERTGSLDRPPEVVRQAITQLRAAYRMGHSKLAKYLMEIFGFPAATIGEQDILFNPDYNHQRGSGESNCKLCDATQIVQREPRPSGPVIHYGGIASGNKVMRNGSERDRISKELGGVLCFEMEAAGLMNILSCLVIRGICDYSDSHKNKNWQPYAAAVAAAYTKELLNEIEPPAQDQTQAATEASSEGLPVKIESAIVYQKQPDAKVSTMLPALFPYPPLSEVLGKNEPFGTDPIKTAAAVISESLQLQAPSRSRTMVD
jgi:nucleoside phosphorylase